MRDRFPVLVAALLIFGVGVFWLFGEAGRRGTFADPMSTYRSAPDGARALFLTAERLGLPVSRRHVDLRDLDAAKTGVLVMMGVDHVGHDEVEKLQKFVSAGGRLVLVAGPEPKKKGFFADLLRTELPVLAAFDLVLAECDSPEIERALEVAIPSPMMRGVEAPEARVAGYVSRKEGLESLPLLLDPHADDRAVGLAFTHGDGRVVVFSAPDLASNRSLARGDNARLWMSLLRTLSIAGPIEFDEFHHGFTGERSISGYAASHGLHWAVLQLLLALWIWVAAQRRFGRPRKDDDEERVGGADYLWAMARIYRQGGHRAHAVNVLLDGLVKALARKAALGSKATVGEVVRALSRRGRPDLARALSAAETRAAGAAANDQEVLAFARTCAGARKLADRRVEDAAHRWFKLNTVRAALRLKRGAVHAGDK